MNLLKRTTGSAAADESGDAIAKRPDVGLSAFRREMERAFERAWRDFETAPLDFGAGALAWPPMDVDEDDKAVTLRIDVPGLGPKDVDVEVSGNQLTVRGKREEEQQSGSGGAERHERYAGSFYRTLTLPGYADAARIEARYDKGVLTVTVPKIPGKGPKQVPVKS